METRTISLSPVFDEIAKAGSMAPQSIALRSGHQEMSYAELDRRSASFAKYLAGAGIVAGETVALCMERSFDWVVAALGILRAGAAYVPLDRGWVKERLSFAVKDSGAKLVVGRAKLLDELSLEVPGFDPERDLDLTAEMPGVAQIPAWQGRVFGPENLAYLIYTSGSSGVPKGVEISHANLAHLIRWHRDAFRVDARDRISHLAGLGFDAAGWEIWPALASGATLCLADDTVRSSPELLRDWLVRERITISFVPTVMAAPMIRVPWEETTRLRFLLTGGDTLAQGPIANLPFTVVNNYGPSECTVVATSGVVSANTTGAPSIGRAISGTTIYLLNDQMEEVPEGTAGEIYIGGDGVGRGYRNLPQATNAAFLPNPFSELSNARIYRSGDVGVRLANGEIEFRGRLDRQVKIRGYRIELDEIGSVLHRHADISFALVITSVSTKGEIQLVAYILPKKDDIIPSVAELQRHLLGSLPDYMIPALFVRLHELPVSLNGKVDLALLERPSNGNLLEGLVARPPSTPIEEKLLAMVQELLHSDAVTMEDDFFLVGGHSLIGMQLVLRLREAFGVDFTLRQLFQASTVEKLASAIETMLIEAIENLSDEEAGMQIAD